MGQHFDYSRHTARIPVIQGEWGWDTLSGLASAVSSEGAVGFPQQSQLIPVSGTGATTAVLMR